MGWKKLMKYQKYGPEPLQQLFPAENLQEDKQQQKGKKPQEGKETANWWGSIKVTAFFLPEKENKQHMEPGFLKIL